MADEHQDEGDRRPGGAADARGRRAAAHDHLGAARMHQDVSALTVDDLSDLERLLTETLDHLLSPA